MGGSEAAIWERREDSKVGKMGEYRGGMVGGSWFYSRVEDPEWVQDFIFLFLTLINEMKEQESVQDFLVWPQEWKDSLDLTEAVKNVAGCGNAWNS